METEILLVRALAVVGERGIDLDRDVAVEARRLLVDGAEEVAGLSDVVLRQAEEDLARVAIERGQLAQFGVVPVAPVERLLEDGRVARDPAHGILANQPLELAGGDWYDTELRELASLDGDTREIFFRLAENDVRQACDL